MRKRYDHKGLPVMGRRILPGLRARDLMEIAGILVAFVGFIGIWVLLWWWVFSWMRGEG